MEFRAALDALAPKDLIRLTKKGEYYAFGTGVEGNDLLNEAIARSLSGEGRSCPADVQITVYLSSAMRSIADAERNKFKREAPAGGGHDEDSKIGAHPDARSSPADTAIARIELEGVLRRLQEVLAHDLQAQAVLIGDMEGWSAEEIRHVESMDDNAYVAARRRVRRIIEREFGGVRQ